MKKVLLTAMALLSVASASVFGMYGFGDSWIDFLSHGNIFRARMDQLGFTLGNGTIKGTFGFRANKGTLGNILTSSKDNFNMEPTVSAGIGYTSSMIGVGLGYNYTFIDKNLSVHTPVLTMNFLDNNLRLAVPIQVAVTERSTATGPAGSLPGGSTTYNDVKYTGVSFNNIQLRYYTGIDAFNALRFYVYYRNVALEHSTAGKFVSESLGFQLRLYFLKTQIENVTINPYLRLEYHTALKGGIVGGNYAAYGLHNMNYYDYANKGINPGLQDGVKQSDVYDYNPYSFTVKPMLAISADTDMLSVLVEPSLGYNVSGGGKKDAGLTHKLAWGAYAEVYLRPVKDLEWYFEMDVNNNTTKGEANAPASPVLFETTTGVTWYLPSFDGSAQ